MIKNSIVLVPFPFDNYTALKVRPALCLTSEISEHKHIVIAFISSQIPKRLLKSDYLIKKESDIWKNAGLAVDSVVRFEGE